MPPSQYMKDVQTSSSQLLVARTITELFSQGNYLFRLEDRHGIVQIDYPDVEEGALS